VLLINGADTDRCYAGTAQPYIQAEGMVFRCWELIGGNGIEHDGVFNSPSRVLLPLRRHGGSRCLCEHNPTRFPPPDENHIGTIAVGVIWNVNVSLYL